MNRPQLPNSTLQAASRIGFACLILAQFGAAQGLVPVPVDTPVRAVHLDLDTGEITRMPSAGADALVSSCFANASFSGFYAIPGAGEEYVDWGVKACGLSGLATELVLGYGTTALDSGAGGPGATVQVTLYSGTLGFCDTKTPVAGFVLTGLPGSSDGVAASAYSLTVDISTQGFFLPDGAIGWGYTATDGDTGPLLMNAPDAGAGTIDAFDQYSPAPASAGSCAGTFAFATPGIASFWMEIGEDDGAFGPGTQTVNPGTGCNLGVLALGAGAPTVGQIWNPGITTDAVASPAVDFIGISTGPLLGGGCIPSIGELLIKIAPPHLLATVIVPSGTVSAFTVPIPADASLIGISASSQAGQFALGQLGLTNGIDFTIGI